MPRFDNSIQFYHEVEVDRREAHKTPTLYFWFPVAWAALLGFGSAYLAWRIACVVDQQTPLNYAMLISGIIPMIFLVYYLAWWLGELTRLNREARPPAEQPYTPSQPVRYETVNTPTNKTYAFLTVSQAQLEQIAAFAVSGENVTYRKLWMVFGRLDRAVEQFRQEAIQRGFLEAGSGRTLVPTLKGIDFFNDVLDMNVRAIPDPDPPPTPPPPVTSESPMRPRHRETHT